MVGLHNRGSGILEALNTRIYGNSTKTVVLSHGFGADQTVWHFIIPALLCYFKVVVYDLVFSPNVDPKLYDPNRYLNAPGHMGGLTIEEVNEFFTNIRQNYLGWVHDLVPRAIGENNTDAIAALESSLSRMNPEIALDVAKTVFLSDNRRVLKYVRVRSTIIQIQNDIFVPMSAAYYTKKRLRRAHAKLIILTSSGHFPQLTDYFELSRAIKRIVLHLHSM